VMRAPTIAGASPARTTSTSGSSGIHLAPERERGGHLGLLLARARAARRVLAHCHNGGEPTVMVRAGARHLVRGCGRTELLRELLDGGLRIHRRTETVGVREKRRDESQYQGIGGFAPRGQEGGAEKRLRDRKSVG